VGSIPTAGIGFATILKAELTERFGYTIDGLLDWRCSTASATQSRERLAESRYDTAESRFNPVAFPSGAFVSINSSEAVKAARIRPGQSIRPLHSRPR
jgi:hypothetical protein